MFGKRGRKPKKKKPGRSNGPSRIGRYAIQDVLGQGGMGTVYLGHDPVIDRNVAIKVITLQAGLSETEAAQYHERFLREARAAGGLQHPNIVAVHDIGQDPTQGQPYIVMEHVPGQDLKKIIRAEAPLPAWKAIRIVVQIASALDFAHGHGIIHRDIKPANALIGEDGQVKIADFGVAHLPNSDLTQTDQFVGSPGFVSPEQLKGAAIDGRSDLFSLGVILYQLLTGHSPFEGDNPSEVMYRISNQPARAPTELHSSIPREFDAILLKALSKDPNERYQTGREMMEALIALEMSGVVTPKPAPAEEPPVANPVVATTARAARHPKSPSPWLTLNSQWRLALLLVGLLLTFVAVNVAIYLLMRGPLGRMSASAQVTERSRPALASVGGTGALGVIGGLPPPAPAPAAEGTAESSCAVACDDENDLSLLLGPAVMREGERGVAEPVASERISAKLRVELDHQLSSGRLIVMVGGKTALSKPFDAPEGTGAGSVTHLLSVPAGSQGVKVQVLGEMGEMRAQSRIDGTMQTDRVAVLRIKQRNRSSKTLTLRWASPE